jgi:hypothetical protein
MPANLEGSMSMRKLAIAVGLIAAVLTVTAAAAPPSTVSGTGTVTSTTATVVRVADGNTFLAGHDAGAIAGSFTGTWETEYTIIVHSSGLVHVVDGTFTCICSVAGRSGSFTLRFEGPVSPSGVLVLHGATIGATGGLAGLHSNVTVEAIFGVGFTYSGTAHFAP